MQYNDYPKYLQQFKKQGILCSRYPRFQFKVHFSFNVISSGRLLYLIGTMAKKKWSNKIINRAKIVGQPPAKPYRGFHIV